MVCLLVALGNETEWAWAHHGFYDSGPRDVLLRWIDGYQVRVQVAPARPRAGAAMEFFVSVVPKGSYPSVPWVREANLWISRDGPRTDPPVRVPMRLRENRPGFFTGEFLLREDGVYRVEVEMPPLRDRVSGSLRLEPPDRWFTRHDRYVAIVILLTVGFVFLLQRFTRGSNGLSR